MTRQQISVLRVFVSSPGDMKSARKCVDKVLAKLNRDPAIVGRARLEAWKWETDAAPRLGPPAQDIIDWQTPPFDIYLGLMSARFGTPTGQSGSGTEHEFRQALQRWQQKGEPWILFYFDENAKAGRSTDGADQWSQVCRFRDELEKLGLSGTYRGLRSGEESLQNKLEHDLRIVALELIGLPVPAQKTVPTNCPTDPAAAVVEAKTERRAPTQPRKDLPRLRKGILVGVVVGIAALMIVGALARQLLWDPQSSGIWKTPTQQPNRGGGRPPVTSTDRNSSETAENAARPQESRAGVSDPFKVTPPPLATGSPPQSRKRIEMTPASRFSILHALTSTPLVSWATLAASSTYRCPTA